MPGAGARGRIAQKTCSVNNTGTGKTGRRKTALSAAKGFHASYARIDDIAADALELKRELVPMLRAGVRPLDAEIPSWSETLVRETRDLMAAVLPLEAHELEFLERLNGAGDIAPELLTAEPAMQAIIRDHPGLKWKALNVKKRLGVATGAEEPTE